MVVRQAQVSLTSCLLASQRRRWACALAWLVAAAWLGAPSAGCRCSNTATEGGATTGGATSGATTAAGDTGQAATEPAPVYPTAYKPTDPTGDFLLKRPQLRVATAEGHRRDDAVADLDALHHLLTRGHISLALADEATRRSWTRALTNARQALRGRDVLTNAEFFSVLRVHLGPLAQTASPVLWADRGKGRVAVRLGYAPDVTALDVALDPDAQAPMLAKGAEPTPDMAGARLEHCTGPLKRPEGPALTSPARLREALPQRVAVWDEALGRVVARPIWEGPAGLDFKCRFKLPNGSHRVVQVASRAMHPKTDPAAKAPKTPDSASPDASEVVEVRDVGEGDAQVRVVRVRALGGDPQALGALRRAGEKAAAAPRAVVDLRGVSRGGWVGAEAFAAPWFYGEGPKVWSWTLASEVTAQGLYNAALADVTAFEDRHKDDPGGRDEAEERRLGDALGDARSALRDSAKAGAQHRVDRAERVIKGEASSPWQGRAVVLIDGGCVGACVALVELLVQLGDGVVVVGLPLDPSSSGGRVALYRLPKTRIRVELPTRARSATPELGQVSNATALWPKIWAGGASAMEVALRQARAGASGGDKGSE